MARTLEQVFRGVERHRAPEMRALAIRGDDPARCVQQEEAAFSEQDRTIVRGGELLQDVAGRADRDGRSETDDPRDPQIRSQRGDEFGHAECHSRGEADAQDLASLDASARDGRKADHAAILVSSRGYQSNSDWE